MPDRDDHETILAAMNWFLPHVSDVGSAEMIAIRNNLYPAAHVGCSKVIIECDRSFAVEAVQHVATYIGSEIATIMKCKLLLEMDFPTVSHIRCLCEVNSVADELAKFTYKSRSSSTWASSFPDFISLHIVNDMQTI